MGHVCDIFDINHVLTNARTENFTIFVLEMLLKYEIRNWWSKNLLIWSNKESYFFTEINKSFTFPGMGQLFRSYYLLQKVWCHFVGYFVLLKYKNLQINNSICKMCQRGSRWGKAHTTHKIVENKQSLKCYHVKRISPTGFIFHTF